MRIQFITIGKPKLEYARIGWDDYLSRLQKFYKIEVTQLHDKYTNDSAKILDTAADSYKVGLVIEGQELSSPALAEFLRQQELAARPLSFIIGGPEGLPAEVTNQLDFQWSFGPLTFPHDLAMVIMLEALFRATTIKAGIPYHK